MADTRPAIPPPPGVTPNFEHPQDALRTVNFATQALSIAIVSLFVAFRIILKLRLHSRLDIEDYATCIGWVLFMGFCACMVLLGVHGGGNHAWEVTAEQVVDFGKVSYATTIIYVPLAFAVKVALLAIMIRIFAPDRKKVISISVSLGILLLYYTAAVFIKIFFCNPISAYWKGTKHGGSCLDQQKVIMADSIITIISDFWILVVPLPLMWSLHMSMFKKVKVIGILGAGGLATSFSVWRLVIVVREGSSPDTTLALIRTFLTANAEAGIGLICACLPMMSSYYSSVRNKALNKSNRSYASKRELDSLGKITGIKMSTLSRNSHTFPNTSPDEAPDEARLISTIEGPIQTESGREGSTTSLPSQRNTAAAGEIHKSVTVSQNFEFVK